MSFLDDIKAFEQKALLAANKSVSNVVEELFTSIVDKTPDGSVGNYSTGLLKNQWYTAQGGSISSEIGTEASDDGIGSLSRIKSILSTHLFYGKDNTVSLSNNVDYARRAEYLGWPEGEGDNGWQWTGKVQPYGMVRKSVEAVRGAYL